MTGRGTRFLEAQRRFFAEADPGHFFWQTQNPYLARTERDLLDGFPVEPGQVVLEVGCGEGGNLVNLLAGRPVAPRLVVGVELFEGKLTFARRHGVPARLVCADALALPFREAVVDAILCRDLLHHLERREAALAEIRRVSKPDGAVWVVEPNGRNPLIWLLALVRPHERGQLRNSVASLHALVARHFPSVEIEVRQPLPLYRLLLHYRLGCPRLGGSRRFAAAMNGLDRLFRAIWPRSGWAYIIAKPGARPGRTATERDRDGGDGPPSSPGSAGNP